MYWAAGKENISTRSIRRPPDIKFSEISTHQKNYEMVWDGPLQVDKISGGCSEMIPLFNFKKIAPPPRPEENQN